jgi:hypothetical protein
MLETKYLSAMRAKANRFNKKNVLITRDLEIKTIKNGLVIGGEPNFGVMDENFNPVDPDCRGRQYIQSHTHCTPKITDTQKQNIKHIPGNAIYIGYLSNAFGHFLTDALPSLWPALLPQYKNAKIAVVPVRTPQMNSVELLKLFGIPDENIILIKPGEVVQFDNVILAEPSYIMYQYIHQLYRETFKRISDNVVGSGIKRIYLTRTNLPNPMFFGEKKIEQLFAKNGFKIIAPETMSVYDQIAAIKDADIIAGVAGTATHMGMFGKDGVENVCLSRSKQQFLHRQFYFNELMPTTFIDASSEKMKTSHFRNETPKIISVNKHLKNWIDDHNFVYTDDDITDRDALNNYNRALCKYSFQMPVRWAKKIPRLCWKIKNKIKKLFDK